LLHQRGHVEWPPNSVILPSRCRHSSSRVFFAGETGRRLPALDTNGKVETLGVRSGHSHLMNG
jgi:hypothetical protein